MAEPQLDHVVKGNPTPQATPAAVAAGVPPSERTSHATAPLSDPTADIPSSPSQIYLNLLIMEASLRSQYLALAARRRQHTSVAIWLFIWVASFFYLQFLRPRDDGSGVGGSPYWLVDMCEMVALISGCIMAVLFHITGQWDRGIRWPRRWFVTANRGLRTMNCKVVIISEPWWRSLISRILVLLPIAFLLPTPGSTFHRIDFPTSDKRQAPQVGRFGIGSKETGKAESVEEDVAPGGDHVKILLLPKHFTPEFREDWEIYRQEYWEQENQRRAELRKKIRTRKRQIAREEGGWLWWTGWRGWSRTFGWGFSKSHQASAKMPAPHVHSQLHQAGLRKHVRRPSSVRDKEGSHSRSSSRSSISQPPEPQDRERRWSTSTTGSIGGARRTKASNPDAGRTGSISRGSMKMTPRTGSRPGTPNMTLRSQASSLSSVSTNSDNSEGWESPQKSGMEVNG